MSLISDVIPEKVQSIQLIGLYNGKTIHIHDECITYDDNKRNLECKSMYILFIGDKIKVMMKSNHDYYFTFDRLFCVRYNSPLILHKLPLSHTFNDAMHKTVIFDDCNKPHYRRFDHHRYDLALHISGIMIDHSVLRDNILHVNDTFLKEVYPTIYNSKLDERENLKNIKANEKQGDFFLTTMYLQVLILRNIKGVLPFALPDMRFKGKIPCFGLQSKVERLFQSLYGTESIDPIVYHRVVSDVEQSPTYYDVEDDVDDDDNGGKYDKDVKKEIYQCITIWNYFYS